MPFMNGTLAACTTSSSSSGKTTRGAGTRGITSASRRVPPKSWRTQSGPCGSTKSTATSWWGRFKMGETTTIPNVLEKEERLKALLAGYGTLAVAYSGGVDSTYLADVAHDVLGDRAVMVLADSPSIPRSEVAEATGRA